MGNPRSLNGDEKAFLERILIQCAYSLGCGAQMPISGEALQAVLTHCRGNMDDVESKPGFAKALYGSLAGADPSYEGKARWAVSKSFIIDCSVEIGRQAAASARARGAVRISKVHDLQPAFNMVSTANSGDVAGAYCPNWTD